MKYYVIAGEASGDLHGSNLIKAIAKTAPQADFRCWGGDLMQAAGGDIVKHYRDLAFMGFIEVVANLRTIMRNLSFCKKDIEAYQPDALILIDYPGFNLRIAKWAKEKGFKIIYYISPQVWAWKENRVKTIKKCVDLMLVILPFEKAFYAKWNFPVHYVGHPLVEVIDDWKRNHPDTPQPHAVALLPGSRKQEILKKLPVMLEVTRHFPQYHFIVAKAPGLEDDFYATLLKDYANVEAVSGKTYGVLSKASAALVTSGTATLETALFGVPEVVCYKGNALSYSIAKRIITIKYISLVNLIMDKLVVKELIQHDMNVAQLTKALTEIMQNDVVKSQMATDYKNLKDLLSEGGNASANAAQQINYFLSGEQ